MLLQTPSRASSAYQRALTALVDGLTKSESTTIALADLRTPDGIVLFVREVLGVDLTPYQEEILRALVLYGRVAVRGCHGLGKTALASWVILWGIAAFEDDVKVPVTASAWRQLEKFTFPEVRKWAARADWSKIGLTLRRGHELLDLAIKLEGKEAFAVASDNPALIEGAHAKRIIYVFDEAKAIPNDTWDAAEGAFSNAGSDTDAVAYALAISTPGAPAGRFYDIHKRKPGYEDWWTRHVTIEEAIAAGRISCEWVDQRRKQWGEKSAVFQNRVLGEFAESSDDALIPLAWVEKGVTRWYEMQGKGEGLETYGLDVARYGEDKSVLVHKVGRVVEWIDTWEKQDTMQTVGNTAAKVPKSAPIGVDVIGIGAGVVDRLRELDYAVTGVNVSQAALDPLGNPITDSSGEMTFDNLRGAIWWLLREAFDPENPEALAIPPDSEDRLVGDLTAPTFSYTSRGKIKVESKDEIKKRIGRSPDYGDAVGIANYIAWFLQAGPVPDWDGMMM
jgi:hypothetical protein